MRKLIIVLLFATLAFGATMGQIPIRETGIVEKVALRPERFDSLENIRPLERGKEAHNILKYLEQEVFFIPVNEEITQKEISRMEAHGEAQKELDSLKTEAEKSLYARINLAPVIVKQQDKVTNLKPRPYSPGRSGGFSKCDSIGNITEHVLYKEVQNKYFTIIDVVMCNINPNGQSTFSKAEKFSSNYGLAFLLKERETGESLLWIFDRMDYNFNWAKDIYDNSKINFALLTPYFIKAQTAFEGKVLISIRDNKLVDINTGEYVNIQNDNKWLCKELTLIPLKDVSLLVPFFILENEMGETIKIKLRDKIDNIAYLPNGFMIEEQYLYEIQQKQMREEQRLAEQKAKEEQSQKKEADFKQMCISKYGQKSGTLIYNGKVTLGMNKEMCILAWGEPYRKNRTIVAGVTREQWVYGWYHYLYFENGVLVGIQD